MVQGLSIKYDTQTISHARTTEDLLACQEQLILSQTEPELSPTVFVQIEHDLAAHGHAVALPPAMLAHSDQEADLLGLGNDVSEASHLAHSRIQIASLQDQSQIKTAAPDECTQKLPREQLSKRAASTRDSSQGQLQQPQPQSQQTNLVTVYDAEAFRYSNLNAAAENSQAGLIQGQLLLAEMASLPLLDSKVGLHDMLSA